MCLRSALESKQRNALSFLYPFVWALRLDAQSTVAAWWDWNTERFLHRTASRSVIAVRQRDTENKQHVE